MRIRHLLGKLAKIKGGYTYSGAASYQVCFPLRAGGELRFMITDFQDGLFIDLYDGALPPMITGFSKPTGETE